MQWLLAKLHVNMKISGIYTSHVDSLDSPEKNAFIFTPLLVSDQWEEEIWNLYIVCTFIKYLKLIGLLQSALQHRTLFRFCVWYRMWKYVIDLYNIYSIQQNIYQTVVYGGISIKRVHGSDQSSKIALHLFLIFMMFHIMQRCTVDITECIGKINLGKECFKSAASITRGACRNVSNSTIYACWLPVWCWSLAVISFGSN